MSLFQPPVSRVSHAPQAVALEVLHVLNVLLFYYCISLGFIFFHVTLCISVSRFHSVEVCLWLSSHWLFYATHIRHLMSCCSTLSSITVLHRLHYNMGANCGWTLYIFTPSLSLLPYIFFPLPTCFTTSVALETSDILTYDPSSPLCSYHIHTSRVCYSHLVQ